METNDDFIPLPWKDATGFYDLHSPAIFSQADFYHLAAMGDSAKAFFEYVVQTAGIFPMAKVLDLGCGSGYMVHQLEGMCEVVGISNSAACIGACRQNYPDSEFEQADMELFMQEGCTHVLALESLAYSDFRKTLQRTWLNLRSGGIFYIKDWCKMPMETSEQTANRRAFEHYWKYFPYAVSELIAESEKAGFRILSYKDLSHKVSTDLFDATLPLHEVEFKIPYPEQEFLYAAEFILQKIAS